MNSNEILLSVKDFQIIKNANLTFTPGLTAIIGQSNNGKSALFRAAKACIYNEPGTTSVRHGCSNYAVGIQMNGHTVILQRGTNTTYKIDKTVYQKIGRTQLPEVAECLGIKELNLNGTNEQINFWDQMEKPFLLDRSETELFRFIVDSGKDNNVTTALKTLTQDRQQITKDITLSEGKLAQLDENIKRQEQELENSEEKLSIYNKVIELGPKIQRVQDMTKLKDKSLKDTNNLSLATKVRDIIEDRLSRAQSSLYSLDTLTRKTELINNLVSSYNSKKNSIDDLNIVLSKMNAIEVPDLNEKIEKYKLLSNLITKSRDKQGTIQELSSKQYPTLSDDFEQNTKKLSNLQTIISNITSKKEQITSLELDVSELKKQIKNINKEINDIGICPTCGQPLHIN